MYNKKRSKIKRTLKALKSDKNKNVDHEDESC